MQFMELLLSWFFVVFRFLMSALIQSKLIQAEVNIVGHGPQQNQRNLATKGLFHL